MGMGSKQEPWDYWPGHHWNVLEEGLPPSFPFFLLSPTSTWTRGKDFSREFLIKTGGCLKKGRLGTHSAFGPLFEQHTVCTAKDNGKDSRAERGGRRARSPSTGKGKGMWASQKSVGTIGSVYVWVFWSVHWLLSGWHLTPGSVSREALTVKQRMTTETSREVCPLSSIPPLRP